MVWASRHSCLLSVAHWPSFPFCLNLTYNRAMETRIAKTVTKVNIRQQTNDFAYWQTQSYQTRLAALEEIRQEYHHWRYGAEPRLQRVYTIVKR
ncbi:hypothetical protein TFLX_02340 [Thermoflexales bacterium]|nr:hypothetical protein TFLX_02340 [Thermoflexales bacterium]